MTSGIGNLQLSSPKSEESQVEELQGSTEEEESGKETVGSICKEAVCPVPTKKRKKNTVEPSLGKKTDKSEGGKSASPAAIKGSKLENCQPSTSAAATPQQDVVEQQVTKFTITTTKWLKVTEGMSIEEKWKLKKEIIFADKDRVFSRQKEEK